MVGDVRCYPHRNCTWTHSAGNGVEDMSTEIRPTFIAPTFGGEVLAHAAPTNAEQRLREEFALLHSAFEQMEKALHNKIDVKEGELLEAIEAAHSKAKVAYARSHEAHARLEVLEAHWFVRLSAWFRGLTWR